MADLSLSPRAAAPVSDDPVSRFEAARAQMIRDKRVLNITFLVLFLGFLAFSVSVSQFMPDRLLSGVPRIFEYFGTILPTLQWDLLFEPRNAVTNKAVPGSLHYWFSDLNLYLRLIWDTILMAVTATLIGTALAFALCFPASRNLAPNRAVYIVSRRVMEICRGVPEILYALVFVFAFGIGPLAGVLAIAIHTVGALGKLFSEVNENASLRPVEGIRSVGGGWFTEIGYGIVPQVLPNFISYALLRFEVNVRASSIVGFVGAGGIGQEMNRVISLYSDDRVLAVLVLVVLLVTFIDLISEWARGRFIGLENLK